MPNHITTRLVIEGPAADLAQWRAAHLLTEDGKVCFDFNTVIPMPTILDGIVAGSLTELAIEAITGKRYGELLGDPFKIELANYFSSPERLAARQKQMDALTTDELAMGRRALEAIETTGHPTWYEWNVANWGTKWNAYAFEIVSDETTRLECRFETAWSTPRPIFRALAARYPTLTFATDSFDEGWNFEAHGAWHDGDGGEGRTDATEEGYARAYGHPYEREEDEDESDTGT